MSFMIKPWIEGWMVGLEFRDHNLNYKGRQIGLKFPCSDEAQLDLSLWILTSLLQNVYSILKKCSRIQG